MRKKIRVYQNGDWGMRDLGGLAVFGTVPEEKEFNRFFNSLNTKKYGKL